MRVLYAEALSRKVLRDPEIYPSVFKPELLGEED